MTRDQIRAVLDRVLSWRKERQEDAVSVLLAMEDTDRSPQLSDGQAEEVQRRIANPDRTFLSLAEADRRLRRPLHEVRF